ncbi:predicted protein [Phaeodactylum tricornutum CCAP 1055/1]|uniref:EamA domain-containing protein n=2 Tax=Phaeodactylum tricornutum TaxID=2850 RepID=B7GAV7_PHATC|nr:predicted protein [Phaeodactylum tricornutum CCAP 1055/1]EEC44325.1 predicted protein [Phaeodactylum tricornutum CCAP 1055/1]|eukprot:XP_002184147.1 predicted protein [Phaeodactylum tricornutum CCAP 1055/1]
MRSSVRGRAMMSGFMGATASCFAKLAFEANNADSPAGRKWMPNVCAVQASSDTTAAATILCSILRLIPRGICLILMIVCNAIMLGSFLEGMEESGSVAGTALATASNFATSAAYGFFLWEEDLSMEWMVGFGMVVVGVLILSTATASKPTQADASKME